MAPNFPYDTDPSDENHSNFDPSMFDDEKEDFDKFDDFIPPFVRGNFPKPYPPAPSVSRGIPWDKVVNVVVTIILVIFIGVWVYIALEEMIGVNYEDIEPIFSQLAQKNYLRAIICLNA